MENKDKEINQFDTMIQSEWLNFSDISWTFLYTPRNLIESYSEYII